MTNSKGSINVIKILLSKRSGTWEAAPVLPGDEIPTKLKADFHLLNLNFHEKVACEKAGEEVHRYIRLSFQKKARAEKENGVLGKHNQAKHLATFPGFNKPAAKRKRKPTQGRASDSDVRDPGQESERRLPGGRENGRKGPHSIEASGNPQSGSPSDCLYQGSSNLALCYCFSGA